MTPNEPPSITRLHVKFRGRKILAEELTHNEALRGQWPVGSVYVAAIQKMFAPDVNEQ